MKDVKTSFEYTVFGSIDELSANDKDLLQQARSFTSTAYAPYSHFRVSAVARLANGEIVKGTNQENASYPVGLCAERALMAGAAALYPGVAIETMAISYDGESSTNDRPIAPCGMCRQALLEFSNRTGKTIRLILSGKTGQVIVIENANSLLPLSFSNEDLKN
jgi:cytidine deaminase